MLRYLPCALVVLACKDKQPTAPPPAPPPKPPISNPTPQPSSKMQMPPAPEITPLVKSNNNFALDLWAGVGSGNAAMSPVSISTALAMAWAGAKGVTADQMKKTMRLEGASEVIVSQWAKISLALQDPGRPLKLKMANRLYGEKHYQFDTVYFTITRKAFDAPLEMVDFMGAPDRQRSKINTWVAERTEQHIKDLLPPQSITRDTRLVIVNAIYFLADWATPFDKEATTDQPFYGTQAKKVPTMHRIGHYRLAHGEGTALLELPYQGDSAAMYILLPDTRDGLADVEHGLTAKLKALQLKLADASVNIALPKFTIDAPALSLGEQLKAMGMPLAFDSEKADFTGIAKPANPKDRLYISAVLHKAFVKVDEKGTEAAAATAVMMPTGMGGPPKSVPFVADHPFLFVIVDKGTGLILFIGRVVDPS